MQGLFGKTLIFGLQLRALAACQGDLGGGSAESDLEDELFTKAQFGGGAFSKTLEASEEPENDEGPRSRKEVLSSYHLSKSLDPLLKVAKTYTGFQYCCAWGDG